MRAIGLSALALLLAGCSVYHEATSPLPDTGTSWRRVATEADRIRLRDWRKAWDEGLAAAEAANAAAIAVDADLFDPDRALGTALPPPGDYRCRTIKLGSPNSATPNYAVGAWQSCRIAAQGEVASFEQGTGAQRPHGLLYPDSDARTIFVGTLVLGDEDAPLRYGLDWRRDMIGFVERIGEARWRLVLPYPRFESKLDLIELMPG